MSQIIDPQEDVVFFYRGEGYKNVDICVKGGLPCRDSSAGLDSRLVEDLRPPPAA
jgi:hypothetical protein